MDHEDSPEPTTRSRLPRLGSPEHVPPPLPPGTITMGDIYDAWEAREAGTLTPRQEALLATPEAHEAAAASRRLRERVADNAALVLTDPRQLGELDAQRFWRDHRHRARSVARARRRVAERGLRAVPRAPRARERGGQAPTRNRGSRRAGASSSSSSTDPGDGESDPEPPPRGPAPRPRFSRPWRRADGQLAERLADIRGTAR